jgi:hypothetical protein
VVTIEEIERAIDTLSREDYYRLLERLQERDQQEWDAQMDRDAASGKLDFLREEARGEREAGLLREWPPAKKQ